MTANSFVASYGTRYYNILIVDIDTAVDNWPLCLALAVHFLRIERKAGKINNEL